jgi:hypothetical protein
MKHEDEIVKQTGITRTRLRVARTKHLKRGKHWEKEGRLIMYTKEGEKEILSVLGFPKETKLVEPKPQIEEQMTVGRSDFRNKHVIEGIRKDGSRAIVRVRDNSNFRPRHQNGEPMEFPARWDGRAWWLARNCPRYPGRW